VSTKTKSIISLLVVAIAVVVSFFTFWPLQDTTKLGLDLQGGLQVVLQAEPAEEGEEVTAEKLDEAKFILENRVNGLGVSESTIETLQNDQFLIQLPGIDDPEEALELIQVTALLEFAIVQDGQDAAVNTLINLREQGFTTREDGSSLEMSEEEQLELLGETELTGEVLSDSFASFDTQTDAPIVSFSMTREGSRLFGDLTSNNIGKRLAIVLDSNIVSAPTIQSQITNQGQITGVGELDDAKNIALVLDAGALPLSLEPVTNSIVGPTLGKESLNQGLIAAGAGLGLVLIYFLVFYRAFGVLTWGSLVVFSITFWGLLTAVGVTLTLPGIAGAILLIGIAADSSIIILERIKDEMRAGKTMRTSMETGFSAGFQTFLDADLVTFVTAAVLFYFGVSTVKGFALILMIGIVVDLFTSYFFKRPSLLLAARVKMLRKPWLIGVRGLPKKDEGTA